MAKIDTCDICLLSIINEERHVACQSAVFEDLLAQIQRAPRESQLEVVDLDLREKIRTGKFRTLDEFKEELDRQKTANAERQSREVRKAAILREAANEFDREFPDPDPVTY